MEKFIRVIKKGGPGSGNFGHEGRPGEVGGSGGGSVRPLTEGERGSVMADPKRYPDDYARLMAEHEGNKIPPPVSSFDKTMREKEFVLPTRAKQNDAELVWADTQKFDEGFKQNDQQYVGTAGEGGIGNRYSSFAEYFKANKEIEVPEVVISKGTWDRKGTVQFINGRHRYAYMRDQGATSIPVALFLSPDTMGLSDARKEGIIKAFKDSIIKGPPA